MGFRFCVKGFLVPFVGFFCGPLPTAPARFSSSLLERCLVTLFNPVDAMRIRHPEYRTCVLHHSDRTAGWLSPGTMSLSTQLLDRGERERGRRTAEAASRVTPAHSPREGECASRVRINTCRAAVLWARRWGPRAAVLLGEPTIQGVSISSALRQRTGRGIKNTPLDPSRMLVTHRLPFTP